MSENPKPIEGEELEAVIQVMDELVRAGVTITYEEYRDLPQEARAALILAREQDKAELAVMIAEACAGPTGFAGVMKKIDGGKTAAQMACDAAVQRHFAKDNGGAS